MPILCKISAIYPLIWSATHFHCCRPIARFLFWLCHRGFIFWGNVLGFGKFFFFCEDVSTHPSVFYFWYWYRHGTRFLEQKYSSNSGKGPHRETIIRPHTYSNWLTTAPLRCPDTNMMQSISVCLSVQLACGRPGWRPQRGSSFGSSLLPLTLLLGEHQFCISLCQPTWYDSLHAIYTTFQMNKY